MTKEDCEALRREIKAVADKVYAHKNAHDGHGNNLPGEAYANIMLAYRHLEDASMRIGKVIQAIDGGQSIYDRGLQDQVVGA